MIGSNLARIAAVALAACLAVGVTVVGNGKALSLRAAVVGADAAGSVLTIDLARWSTDAERTPLLTALTAPVAAPAPTPAPAAPAGGRAAGRGGRGGRGAAPLSPSARLSAAVKAAPTVGYIWGNGPTGYSIKYAWQSASADGRRIVLVTDRQLGVHQLLWPPLPGTPEEAEFTVIELRLDQKGRGEAKTSLVARVIVDAGNTLALDGYAAAPVQLEVTP